MANVVCSCGEVFEAVPDPDSGVVVCPGCGSTLKVEPAFTIKKKHVLFGVLGSLALLVLVIVYFLNPGLFILLALIGAGLVSGVLDRPPKGPVFCPKCGGRNIQVVSETSTKSRGCLSALLNFFIMFFVWWIWLFVWLARGKKTVAKTKAVCLSCQNQWYI